MALTRITSRQITHGGDVLADRLGAVDAWTVSGTTAFALGDAGPGGTGVVTQAAYAITLAANATITAPSDMDEGQSLDLVFVQDATGGRTVTFSGSEWKVAWSNSGNTAGKVASLRIRKVGGNLVQTGAQLAYV